MGGVTEATLFPSDLWRKYPPKGEMFIWAHRNGRGGWDIGLGYWCKDGGWAGATHGRTGREHLATDFHPMPEPPNG